MKVTFIGQKELEDALRKLPKELVSQGLVARHLKKAGKPIYDSAKTKVPVSKPSDHEHDNFDPGRLRDAIHILKVREPKYLDEIVGIGVDLGKTRADPRGAWYGRIVEFNQPFLRPSFEAHRARVPIIYGKGVGAAIERIGRKVGNENAQKVGAKAKRANTAKLKAGSGNFQPSVQNLLNFRKRV